MVMSFGPMGMSSGMGMSSVNVYQSMKEKYGCGHADFGETPVIAPYPMEILPQGDLPVKKGNWIKRLFGGN